MNLPNKLTLTRIILVPVFMIFVSLTSLDGIVDGNFNATFYLLAGIVFAAASFTDFLDGHLARKWHMVTDFGKFADPLADKLLTTVAFIYMLRDGVCSPVVLCIILVPVFMIFVSLTEFGTETFNATWYLVAGIVFAAASFTDYLDGHVARKWNMVTDFGKFADPLADKLLTTVALIYMMRDGVCSPVVLCIILAREFAVSGLRMVAAGAKDGKVIAANMWGKVKTVLQMLSIIFYFFGTALSYRGTLESVSIVVVVSIALCWLVAAVTAISGIKYLWDNRSFINTAK